MKLFSQARLATLLLATACYAAPSLGFTRPSMPPEPDSSDDVIVTKYVYDDAGRQQQVIDNLGRQTRREYDAMGRTEKVIENYVDGSPADANPDEDRVTTYTYNAAGQVTEQTADLEGTGNDQTTTYVYSADLTLGSETPVKSNRLLRGIIYPDSSDAVSSGDITGTDHVEMTYLADGSLATRTDPRGTVLTYTYGPGTGRRLSQRITTVGSDTDTTVQSVTYAYDDLGRPRKITSHGNVTSNPADTTDVESQVTYHYNGLGQLTAEYQQHGGVVDDDGVGGNDSPSIQYAYDTTVSGDELTKGHRRTSVTYPNGRIIHTVYDGHGGIDDAISRANELADDNGSGSAGDAIATYSYLGGGTTVIKDYPTPDVRLDYFGGTSDTYAGFDRFGRVISHPWLDYSAGAGNEVDVIHIAHGYDRASNRLYADRQVYQSYSEDYTYDQLHRLTQYEKGQLDPTANGGTGAVSDLWKLHKQAWTLDAVGNQLAVDTEIGNDFITATFNAANEMTTRDSLSDQRRPLVSELDFDSSTETAVMVSVGDSADGVSSDAFDVNTTNAGKLTISAVGQDTFGGVQEEEARTMVLIGDNICHLHWETKITFPSGTSSGQAGFVFGYKSPNDYWLYVIDFAAQKRRIYQVVDGVQGAVLDEKNQSISAGSGKKFDADFFRSALDDYFYDFPGGCPSGRVGYYSNLANVLFDYSQAADYSTARDMAGRWDNYYGGEESSYAKSHGWIMDEDKLVTVPNSVALLKGVRASRFEAVFSLQRQKSSSTDELRFLFNASDSQNWQAVRFDFGDPGVYGEERVNGKTLSGVSMTSGPATLAVPSDTETIWLRVTSGGTTVKVYGKIASSQPSSWSDSTDLISTSTNFDSSPGGRFGFGGDAWQVRIDNFTLKTDRDSNGSYETTEAVEHFTIDANGYAEETLTHDAAGNLTYDGVYQFTYDAWNRLVKVTKAYRDPGSGNIATGSVVTTMQYDGQGRRTVKAVTNSGGLDATYHYYLDGQSLVETRNGSDQVLKQHVWNTTPGGYIDELIQVGLNIDPQNADTGTATENLCERFFWPLHNANFNVMALLNAGGVMVERYEYTPYGGRTVFSHGWMLADFNNDGVVGQGDVDLVLAHWGGTSDADQVAEAGDNGLVGQYELALVLNNYGSALPNDPQVHHPTAGSFRGDPDAGVYGVALNDIGHQGLMHDEEIGLIYNRARVLRPDLGRFMQRDPLGYVDGMNQYEYTRSNPVIHRDPSGTMVSPSALRNLTQATIALELKSLCNEDCLGECPENCTKEKCEEEASKIAASYVNVVTKYAQPKQSIWDGFMNDESGGHLCYDWRTIVYRELAKDNYECFKIAAAASIDSNAVTHHNWVNVTVSSEAKPSGDCTRRLDPWLGGGWPAIYNDKSHGVKCNAIGHPAPPPGFGWGGQEWDNGKPINPWFVEK